MRHQDALWKGALEDFSSDFLKYFYSKYIHQIDFSKGIEFLDKELQQISPQSQDSRRYVDKLFKVFLKNGEEKWILVHVEIQGYLDEKFAERMYIYQYRIFDTYKVKVAALAIFTDDNKNFHPKEYRSEIFGTVIHYQYSTFKLMDKTAADFKNNSNPFSIIMEAAWLDLRKNKLTDEQLLAEKVNLYKKLVRQTDYSKKQIHDLLTWIKNYTPFENKEISLKFDKTINKINKKIATMGVQEALLNSYREEGIEIGEEKGMEKGIEKGEVIGIEKTLEVVEMLKEGISVAEIAKKLNLPQQTVLKIKKTFDS